MSERVEQARAASPVVFGRECYFPLDDVMALIAQLSQAQILLAASPLDRVLAFADEAGPDEVSEPARRYAGIRAAFLRRVAG